MREIIRNGKSKIIGYREKTNNPAKTATKTMADIIITFDFLVSIVIGS